MRNDTQEWESIPRAATEVEVYWAVYWAGRGRVPDAAARGDIVERREDHEDGGGVGGLDRLRQ